MITLPDLPYPRDALEPHISAETLDYHHGKHHAAYVDKLNAALPGSEFEQATLTEIIQKADGALFNNAAQVWNHTFYFHCLGPMDDSGEPTGPLATRIEKDFGGVDAFKKQFTEQALANFGSGWTWLVKREDGSLAIVNTDDADTPVRTGGHPVLTVDIWEHAYYIDHRNARPAYLEAFWQVVNWSKIGQHLHCLDGVCTIG